jgi:sugar O-acyltransferase (sialic acid O-acetyltransferase NeuD family)
MKKICIIGASGFAREAYCIIADLGLENDFFAFLQSDNMYEQGTIFGKEIQPLSKFDPSLHTAVIAIADPKVREMVANQMPEGTEYISLIHPSAVISRFNVEIGTGAIICAGSILTCDIKLGKHAILNLATTIGHDCEIGDYFTTTPAVNISGRCKIGNRVYLGTNAALRGHNVICDDVVVGMGAVVLKNIASPGVYVGNPITKLS